MYHHLTLWCFLEINNLYSQIYHNVLTMTMTFRMFFLPQIMSTVNTTVLREIHTNPCILACPQEVTRKITLRETFHSFNISFVQHYIILRATLDYITRNISLRETFHYVQHCITLRATLQYVKYCITCNIALREILHYVQHCIMCNLALRFTKI